MYFRGKRLIEFISFEIRGSLLHYNDSIPALRTVSPNVLVAPSHRERQRVGSSPERAGQLVSQQHARLGTRHNLLETTRGMVLILFVGPLYCSNSNSTSR